MLNHKTIKTIIFLAIGFIFARGETGEEVVNKEQTSIQEIDTTKLEKYERKVIIDAKWGSDPGEFGVIKEACGIAPNCYTIDKNGNIYIVDPVNAHVQIFDANGKYLREFEYVKKEKHRDYLGYQPYDIAVDSDQNIYILFYIHVGRLPGQSVEVRKYNLSGEFIENYPIPLELLGPTDEEIEAGMPTSIIKARLNSIIIEDNKIKVRGWFEPEYLMTEKGEEHKYTLVEGNARLTRQSVLRSKEIVLCRYYYHPNKGWNGWVKEEKTTYMIDSKSKKEIAIVLPNFPTWDNHDVLSFIHEDTKRGILYFTTSEIIGKKDGWDIKQCVLLKYNAGGMLLALIRFPYSEWGSVTKPFYFDDANENIYSLVTTGEGLQLMVAQKVY